MNIGEVKQLIVDRKAILKKNENDNKVSEYSDMILSALKKHFNNYPCDFIIETLTHLGQAPNVIYDDNGLFAVSSAGYQPVVTGKQKIEGMVSTFVERKMWKNTIRKALWQYLHNEN